VGDGGRQSRPERKRNESHKHKPLRRVGFAFVRLVPFRAPASRARRAPAALSSPACSVLRVFLCVSFSARSAGSAFTVVVAIAA